VPTSITQIDAQLPGLRIMMTLAQLRTFRTVARLNNFSRAAEELHLTQPAISAQVVALEHALKTKLFDRMGKRIALTEQGKAVLGAAEDIASRIEQMQIELDDLGTASGGHLRLGASLIVGVYLLPEVLAKFKTDFPRVELAVRIDPAREIIDMILRNELDLAIIGEGGHVDDERIAVKPVLRDELIVIVPPSHPLAEIGMVSPADLAELPFVLPARDSASADSMLDQLRAEGITLKSVLELGNVGSVKHAVEAGLGVSIVSRYAVLHELANGRLCSVRLIGMKLERDLSLCWYHDRPFSKTTTAFIQHINEYLDSIRVQ
jgi:DNA-binding transcriptional LysR family regulator